MVNAHNVRPAWGLGTAVGFPSVATVKTVEVSEDAADDGRFGHATSVTDGTVASPDEQQWIRS